MKVLDRYIIRELLVPTLFTAIALIFLILIADLFDNLDALIRNRTPFGVILQYYLSLIPYSFVQIIPWAAWLSTLFLLVNFGFHSETLAMKAAGLKITTIIKPILFIGFLLGILTFIVSDRVVPGTYRKANEIREIHIEKNRQQETEKIFRNVTYYANGSELYYFRTFKQKSQTIEGVVALLLTNSERNKRLKVIARKGVWKNEGWEFQGVTEYPMDARGRILGEPQQFEKKRYPGATFSPKELATASSKSMFLSYKELKKSIQKLKENGVRVRFEVVDLQSRLASPWQTLVMMLITIPFLARTTNRKTIALNVLFCVGFIFTYHVSGAVGTALGNAGKLLPFMSAWLGNILFSVGGLVYLDRANY